MVLIRRSRRQMRALAGLLSLTRPETPSLVDLVEGLNLARLDSFEATPASMVLDRAGVRTAADLMRLLRLTSIDSALMTLEWAQGSELADTGSTIAVLNGFAADT